MRTRKDPQNLKQEEDKDRHHVECIWATRTYSRGTTGSTYDYPSTWVVVSVLKGEYKEWKSNILQRQDQLKLVKSVLISAQGLK